MPTVVPCQRHNGRAFAAAAVFPLPKRRWPALGLMIEIDYCASASSRRRIDFLYGRRPLATVSSSVAAGLSRPFHRAARPQTTKGGHLGRPTCAASPRRHVTRINPIGRDTHTHARTETHGRKPKAAIDTRNDADESPAAAAYDEKRRGRRRKKKRRSLQRRRPPARNPQIGRASGRGRG